MCKAEKFIYHKKKLLLEMKVKFLGDSKLKNSLVSKSRMSLWMIRAITILLLWSCCVHLVAVGGMWGPRLLKGWPSCFNSHHDLPMASQEMTSLPIKIALPPKSKLALFCFLVMLALSATLLECLKIFLLYSFVLTLRAISEQWLSYGFLQWRTQPSASCGKRSQLIYLFCQ